MYAKTVTYPLPSRAILSLPGIGEEGLLWRCLRKAEAFLSIALPRVSPQKLFSCILYFLAKSYFSRVDDEDFSQRPEQEPKEKATEETESLSWEFKVLFYP